MRNRLTFPSAGMETKYVWDRHNIQNNGIYIWDKHNIIEETKYYWDKYALLEKKQYYWKKYSLKEQQVYKWHSYPLNKTTEFVKNVWETDFTESINFVFDTSYTRSTNASIYANSGYIKLFGIDIDGKEYTKILNVTELINNNIAFYGFRNHSIWYGASVFNTLSQANNSTAPPVIFSLSMMMPITSNNQPTYAILGYKLKDGNTATLQKVYRGEPNTTYTYQETRNYQGRIKLLSTEIVTGDDAKTILDSSGTSKYMEIQNSPYLAINNNTYGYLVDWDSYEVLTSTESDAYSNDTNLGPNYGDKTSFIQYEGEDIENIKGDYLETVIGEMGEYPDNGVLDGYWYETIVIGNYYWDKYNTKVSNYLYNSYEYNATVLQKIVCQRFKLSKKGVTFVCPIYGTEGGITGYEPVTGGELTDIYWPEGGSTDIAFWLTLDDFWHSTYYSEKNGLLPIEQASNYTESSTDYNNQVPEAMNRLYGKEMLKYTTIVGIGFRGTDYDRNYRAYLFTPNTVWGRESGTGAVLLNDVIPLSHALPGVEWETASNLCWQFGNTATEENGGYYVDYIYTGNRIPSSNSKYLIYDQDRTVDKDYIITDDNPLFYEIPAEIVEIKNNRGFGNTFNSAPAYKDTVNGYYYIFYVYDSTMEYGCYYDGEIGQFKGTIKSEYGDLTERYPLYLPTSTSTTTYYELVGEEYGKGNTLIGQVSSRQEDAYPTDGMIEGDNSAYYVYSHFEEEDNNYLKGEFIEQVESTNPDEYPLDKYQGQNWYVYTGNKLFKYRGDYIETVNAETINEYPKDGITGGYWYVYQRYENNGPYKSRWVDEVETNIKGFYPTDGIQGNYWYVYKKSYDGYRLQINDWQIKGGVDYKHNINPEKDFTIGCVASAEIDFNYDNRQDDFQKYLDADYCDYWTWQPNDKTWRLIGRFWLTDAEYNRNLVKVKAFDAILATDAYVDEFIANTTYPISITNFFNNLCQLLGVTGRINSSLANTTFTFQDNFEAINITARQLLQYIAEATGGFIKVEPDGTLYLTTYSSSGKTLDNSNYISYTKQRYTVEPISGLTVKMNSDDLGVSSGDVKNNPYIIENNPLFYTQSDQEISNAVYRLYHNINDKVYRPATIQLLQDFGINCGDIITINGDTFYVMSKELSASGCKLECFGNQYREKQPQSINSEIVALRGKTNELYRDLEKTQSTLTDTANGLQSQITQTASSIRSEVSDNKKELESKIEQTASNITTTVSDNKKELESKINQTAESITQTITSQGQTITEIRQDLDGISLTYNSTEGTASITIGDITISQLVDGKYVDRVVAGIDFSGYCRFSDLSTPGSTVICGDNITTGTISADRINMTGSISWGDLSSSCQDTIASFAGSGGSGGEVPSYIKSTYIDATTIKSPTIYGAKIYAGTSAEGYIKLASTGMNFYSNSGGSVCGIGYYPGKYSLPYIILGQGVDDVGTDKGMIKKYTNGIWIGDSDNISSDSPGGTGIFINFTSGTIQKYINGSVSTL